MQRLRLVYLKLMYNVMSEILYLDLYVYFCFDNIDYATVM